MPLVFCFSTEPLSSFTTKRCLNLAGLGSEVCCTVRATLTRDGFFSKRPTVWGERSWIAKGRKQYILSLICYHSVNIDCSVVQQKASVCFNGFKYASANQKSTHIKHSAVLKLWAGLGECLKTQKYVSTYKNMKDMKVHKEHRPLPRHWSYQTIQTVKTWTGFKFGVSALSID